MFGSDSASLVFLPIGAVTILVLVAVLLGRTVRRPSLISVGLLITVVAVAVLGDLAGPRAAGSLRRASGTASATTVASGASVWSGAVTCEWRQGETTIGDIGGLKVPLDASAKQQLLLPAGPAQVTGITWAHSPIGPGGKVISMTDVSFEVSPFAGGPAGVGTLDTESDNRRSGTATSNGLGITVTWRCDGGP
ncbi:MAG: hypothetical protein HY262_03165 [Chloroflexi bacterium]|nr:hypothetical protein [Chloroflexota bacterium]